MAATPEAVLARVRRIPEGRVTTYGDLTPGAPRHAGRILSEAGAGDAVPWWRVVRADGSLPKGERQARHLRREGVPFRGVRVDVRTARVVPQALDAG